MRFADMMNRVKQNIAWPNERARPDAVLELEPKFDSTYRFPEILGKAATPSKVDGKFLLEYVNAGDPLPQVFFPAWIEFDKYKLKNAHSSRRGSAWPSDVSQVMPDFFRFDMVRILISEFARSLFNIYVPGKIDYIEVDVKTPPDMIRASSYYFIKVLAQAQTIDWSRIDPVALARAQGNPIGWHNSKLHKAVPFKRFSEGSDLLWHEKGLDAERRAAPGNIYVRGKLWNILVEEFDQQFQHRTQLSLEE